MKETLKVEIGKVLAGFTGPMGVYTGVNGD